MTSKEQLIDKLEKRFPDAWFKDGDEWRRGEESIWTGEGSYDKNGLPLFDYYGSEPNYIFGVKKIINDFVERHGWYFECHDAGTYFIYPNF